MQAPYLKVSPVCKVRAVAEQGMRVPGSPIPSLKARSSRSNEDRDALTIC